MTLLGAVRSDGRMAVDFDRAVQGVGRWRHQTEILIVAFSAARARSRQKSAK